MSQFLGRLQILIASQGMIDFSKLGIMQGRLSAPYHNKIQHFPHKFWQDEFYKAKELNLKSIQWVYEYENYHKNPLYLDPYIIKKTARSTGVKGKFSHT